MAAPEQSLLRSVRATMLIGGLRLIGIMWPILLASRINVAFYGRFAIAIAASNVIAAPLDMYYVVRAPRISDDAFGRDQASRVWTGLALVAGGLLVWPVASIAGFALTKAGLDIVFNARMSAWIRNSRPDRALAEDAVGQLISLAVCVMVLVAFDARSLTLVGACYLVGYLPFSLVVMHAVIGVRPRLPERSRTTAFLTTEAFLGMLYLQGDVILLGWLLTNTQVAYYSLVSQVALTAGLIGQAYSSTFHDRLRENNGAASAGPTLLHIWLGAGVCAVGMTLAGLALVVVGAPRELCLTVFIFAGVAALRFCSSVFTTVLALQCRDLYRLRLSAVAMLAKTGMILVLWRLGSPGGALAFLVGDAIAVVVPQRTLYRVRRPSPAPVVVE